MELSGEFHAKKYKIKVGLAKSYISVIHTVQTQIYWLNRLLVEKHCFNSSSETLK